MSEQGHDSSAALQAIASRYGVGLDAVHHLLGALERGQGSMAQFDHPDLGGMGQWSSGGMIMVGRMFDNELRARVAGLFDALVATRPAGGWTGEASRSSGSGSGNWWPSGLGAPSSVGSQNGLRYAYFPETRRLAIDAGSGIALYDTGEHHISGVSQSNGTLVLSGAQGTIALDRLRRVGAEAEAAMRHPELPQAPAFAPKPHGAPEAARGSTTGAAPAGDVLATIERLAELHARGVLTEAEFTAKKAELLSRL